MKKRKSSKINVFLLAFTVLFMCVSLALGYQFIRLYKRNLHSKNINLGENYFLANHSDENSEKFEMLWNKLQCGADYKLVLEKIETTREFYGEDTKGQFLWVGQISTEVLPKGNRVNVPLLTQHPELPNGCEIVSASMLLQYLGFSVDPVDLADRYLKTQPVNIRSGVRYGPDPAVAYAGNPKSEAGGWGCFSPVIEDALKKFLPKEYEVFNLQGASLENLSLLLTKDIPVCIWVTQDYSPAKSVYQWLSYDETKTYLYPVGQHCVVLTGFDENYYYLNDPLKGEVVKVEKEKLEKCYRSMGYQAVTAISDSMYNIEENTDTREIKF